MADQNFLTAKTHAVLKLQLGEKGGTRRINFSRLWDVNSNAVSYSKLEALAVEYSFPEDAPHDVSKYEILVTYVDEDGDSITISSDDELSEAFLQFVGKSPPVLRASAKVKRTKVKRTVETKEEADANEKKTPSPAKESKEDSKPTGAKEEEEEPTIAPGDEHTGPSRQTSGIGGSQSKNDEPPPLETLVKSIASLLSSVAVSVQNNIAEKKPATSNSAAASATSSATSSATATEDAKEAEKFVKDVIDKISLASTKGAAAAATAATAAAAAAVAANKPPANKNESKKIPSTDGFDPTFIHGHHTCDGCMRKPIVGIRYHATNRSDYDLCQSCMEGKGVEESDVDFTPAELDRDRPHQIRWKLLYEEEKKTAEEKKGGEIIAPKESTATDDGGKGLNPSFIHGRHTCDGCLKTPIIGLRYHASNLPDYDLCQNCVKNYKGDDIKFEPVELDRDRPLQHRWQRRQMRRARQARFASQSLYMCPSQAHSQRVAVMDVALKEAIRRSLLEANANRASSEESGEEIAKLEEEEDAKMPAEEPAEELKKTAAPKEEDSPPFPPMASEAPTPLFGREENKADAAKDGDTKETAEEGDIKMSEEKDEKEEDNSVKVEAKGGDEPKTPVKETEAKAPFTPESAKSTFSEDAAGIGAAAEAIGATLDACAGAIDEIVSEFDKVENNPPEEMDALDSVSAMTSSILSVEESKQDDKTGDSTAIKPFEQKNKEPTTADADDGEDEWEVVGDNALAMATHFVGSALFESQNSTALSNSGVDSIPSSVPTISSPTTSSRWQYELKQLRELGFTDDRRSVDALERLEAANKDVDSSDPVTVSDAVNYLLAQNGGGGEN